MSATVQEVAVLRHRLLAKGQELASMLSDLMSGKNPARSTCWTPSRARPRRRRLRRYLGLIQGRIDAIAAGSFGKCVVCGGDILAVELTELPWVERCRRCAS